MMNTKISRRAALGALAATAAHPAASFAATVSDDSAPSRLAELIAEYRQAKDHATETFWRLEALDTAMNLPAVRVAAFSDSSGYTKWLYTDMEIRRYSGGIARLSIPNAMEISESMMRDLRVELSEVAEKHRIMLENSGLSAVDAEHEAAQDRLSDALWALLAFVPSTLEEYRERDAFLYERFTASEGDAQELDHEQLKALFSA